MIGDDKMIPTICKWDGMGWDDNYFLRNTFKRRKIRSYSKTFERKLRQVF